VICSSCWKAVCPICTLPTNPKDSRAGRLDYILTKKDVPIGFVEAKDIGDPDLDGSRKGGNKEQFDRYKASLGNLIFTDYLHFHLYRDGQFITKVAIAEIHNGSIRALPENYNSFSALIRDFGTHIGQTIKSPRRLAELMAGKACLLADILEKALTSDETHQHDSTLKDQMTAFKHILIHDITPRDFADVYAQTIAYGMFAARLHDPTLSSFTRQEAAELIPRSNPFLRKLFGYIAGPDIDDRIKWIVDSLADIFLACNVEEILKNYGKATKMEDPIIHFYETFLAEYNPKLRKARGVWYTPQPVVSFIVRAVDDILKTEFNLPNGLADNSKTKIKVNMQGKSTEQAVHKVQILDPATGTGTFLAEVVKQVHKNFEGQQGIWSNYVENHLLPRLNGFELLMASYAMAHLKLDLLLTETGYKPTRNQRLRVYLTNSLEEHHADTGTLFASWLSAEANEANHIKRDTPVMVVMGNPPYSGESANKGEWIMQLMEDYKKEPGGKEKLKEKNSKWINDDYVKFLRYGQHFIEKNGSGILAFINPHGFLDNPTFRGMRWNLLKIFDKIYTIDLHGNSKKKETAPDGGKDENIFDIMQGVSINIFIKTGNNKDNQLGKVFHFDIFGKREIKYNYLIENSLKSINFKELPIVPPNYFFVSKDLDEQKAYDNYFSINSIFNVGNSGVVTKRDKLNIHNTKEGVIEMLHDVINLDEIKCRNKYNIPADVRDWNFSLARKDISETNQNSDLIQEINYRPFDKRYFYYSGKSKGVVGWPVPVVSDHLLHKDNLGFMTNKKVEVGEFKHYIIYKGIVESHAISMKEINYVFPLYLYPNKKGQQTLEQTTERTPNLNAEIVKQIAEEIGLEFVSEETLKQVQGDGSLGVQGDGDDDGDGGNVFAPIDILDYIYAVLHSPTYREKYKEFLKIDFPRVPYPKDKETFWQLVKLGGELRQIHLLESPVVTKYITQYQVDGNNEVEKIRFVLSPLERGKGSVYINETQYFANVPEVAWNFYIGGYQPAQKWLKDRKGRKLEFEDILHYQKIIVALTETDRLMKEIDNVGWE
jgi:predicted helicase